MEINITPKFSGAPIQPDAVRYETSAGEKFSIARISYLLQGFALQRADGSWLELTNEVAWFDLEKARSFHRIEFIPSGEYRSIRFHVGPDEKLNHADIAQFPAEHPLNPNLNNLHWSWQGGYIFLALEGMWEERSRRREESDVTSDNKIRLLTSAATNLPSGWAYHLARDTNRTAITLAVPLELINDIRLELAFDIATLLNAPRPLSFAKDGASTHSRDDDAIAAALVANLPGSFQVSRVGKSGARNVASPKPQPLYMPVTFTPFRFQMSAMFPIPDLASDNPLIEERVALGEKLFHETLLSKDNTISCASCHKSEVAFTDPRRFSIGVRQQVGTRNAMPLFNLAWRNSFFWDGRAPTLRAQALMPIQDHTEMDENLTNVVKKLQSRSSRREEVLTGIEKPEVRLLTSSPTNQEDYPALFIAAFGSPEITPEKIGLAFESFLLTLTSFDSKFDRAFAGKAQFNEDEKRGLELFMTEFDPRREQFGADCFHCHGGPLFQSQTFANNGLDVSFKDAGRAKVTGRESDQGKFATPSLRNIALTAPYMHDGRFATLEEVVEHYSTGVKRSATLDPNLAKHPGGGVPLSVEDKRALVAFLKTLTDEKFVRER